MHSARHNEANTFMAFVVKFIQSSCAASIFLNSVQHNIYCTH
uniref:Uncharacterized protein n=1 Tax=Arundo donax TaxID=35708 RepID=A0A0A9HUC0_ARUDO